MLLCGKTLYWICLFNSFYESWGLVLGHWGEKGRYSLGIWYSFKKTLKIGYAIFQTLWKQKLVHRHSMCSELDHLPPSALPLPLPAPPSATASLLCLARLPAGSNLCCHMKEQRLSFPSLSALTSLPVAWQSPWQCQCSIPSLPRPWMSLSFMACLVHCGAPFFWGLHLKHMGCKAMAGKQPKWEQLKKNYLASLSPLYLQNWTSVFTSLLSGSLTLLQCCTFPWRTNVNWWGISVVSVHWRRSLISPFFLHKHNLLTNYQAFLAI